MSNLVVFDTSVLIDQLRTSRHQARIQAVNGLLRNSAVVLSELWRGATTSAEQRVVRALERNHPVLAPNAKNWVLSGQILGKMRMNRGFGPGKLRDLHFDVLIALTARSAGARLITSNGSDFELIAKHLHFQLEIWP